MDKQTIIEAEINEASKIMQTNVINNATSYAGAEVAEEILPQVKAKRSTWTWEVINIEEVRKKMIGWTEIVTKDDKIDEYLKAKKAEGILVEDFIFAGVRFFLNKTY